MIRTDLVFRVNREGLEGLKRKRSGWGCFLVCLLLVGMAFALATFFFEGVRDRCAKVVPWLQSRGRVVIGKTSLIPVQAVIDRSDMTLEQKVAAKDLLDESWRKAEQSGDVIYRREDVINLARKIVESRPGLYYALGVLQNRGVDYTRLDALQKKMADRLFRETMEDMAEGRITPELVEEFRGQVHLLVLDAKTGFTEPKEKERGEMRLRSLLKVLNRLNRARSQLPPGGAVDMAKELVLEIRQFRDRLEDARRRVD